jgi:hypothetical protein
MKRPSRGTRGVFAPYILGGRAVCVALERLDFEARRDRSIQMKLGILRADVMVGLER